jgi:hypothetical protein
MYRVKGADQNIYGPIPAETVRQWIGERRLDRESVVNREGEEAWLPLGQMPEFADAFGVAMSMGGAPDGLPAAGGYGVGDARELALAQVRPPAIGLTIFGGLMLAMTLIGLVATPFIPKDSQLSQLPDDMPEWVRRVFEFQASMPAWASYVQGVIGLAVFAVVVMAGLRLMKLRSRGLVMTGAILAMLPCFTSCCCIVGMPLGIWAIVVLNKPDVASQFE